MKNSVLAAALVAALSVCEQAQAGDIAKGKAIFDRTCGNCHPTQIGMNKIGPSLWAVVGRPVASVPDFNYSGALIAKREDWQTWDEKRLEAYLVNPREVLHGSRAKSATVSALPPSTIPDPPSGRSLPKSAASSSKIRDL